MKAELNKEIRIKASINREEMDMIRMKITARINQEYAKELNAYEIENKKFYQEENVFHFKVYELLRCVDTNTKLRIVTQVGKNSSVLNEYIGHLEYEPDLDDTYFNFISEQKGKDERPFTIGFSCLQSIEVIDKDTICRECGNIGKPSKGLLNGLVSFEDFGSDAGQRGTTQSRVGEAELVDVLKCVNCGHSWVK